MTSSHTPQHPAGDDLVARLRKLVSLNEPQNGGPYSGDAAQECMRAMTQAADRIEALTSQQHTEPVAGEVERYIARANELAEDGRYPWWSRLAEILSSYDALAAAKDAKTEKWRAACMEAREGCNQRSDTIRSLRSHLEAAERQRDALREALNDIASWTQAERLLWWQIRAREALKDEGGAT